MFSKIGWFVTNEYVDDQELQMNKPATPVLEKVCNKLLQKVNANASFSSNVKSKLMMFALQIIRVLGGMKNHPLLMKMSTMVKLLLQLVKQLRKKKMKQMMMKKMKMLTVKKMPLLELVKTLL